MIEMQEDTLLLKKCTNKTHSATIFVINQIKRFSLVSLTGAHSAICLRLALRHTHTFLFEPILLQI